MSVTQKANQATTAALVTDGAIEPLDELIRRAETTYLDFYTAFDLEEPWHEERVAYCAVRRELDARVRELVDEVAPALFDALDRGDSREILRAARAFRQMPACARRFVFIGSVDFDHDGDPLEDCEPTNLTDVAIARRMLLAEKAGAA